METDTWPGNDVGLAVLSTGYAQPSNTFFVEPDQLRDPWNREYIYITPGPDGRPFEILTYGADGQPGGENENRDLSSANLRGDDQ
jgi:general secretion pathway protein G